MSDERSKLGLNWNAGIKLNTHDGWYYEWWFENAAYPRLAIGSSGSALSFESAVRDMNKALQDCTTDLYKKKLNQVQGLLKDGYKISLVPHDSDIELCALFVITPNGEEIVSEGFAPLLQHLDNLVYRLSHSDELAHIRVGN